MRDTARTEADLELVGRLQVDALVGAVLAGDIAEVAADALLVIDAGDALPVEVEVLPLLESVDRFAAQVGEGLHSLGVEVGVKAVVHVLHDAEAIVHDGGADLEGGGAEGDELGGVAPGGDAADAGDGQVNVGVGGAGLQHVQGDGLHRRAAIAAVRAEAADGGLGHERVEVHVGDRVDRVDERDGVGPGAARGAGGHGDVGDVGRELDDDGDGGGLHDPARDFLDDGGLLADGGAHAALAHAVRAAVVELDAVGAGIGGALDELVPLFARLDHERGDDGVVRPALFDLGDFAEVNFG